LVPTGDDSEHTDCDECGDDDDGDATALTDLTVQQVDQLFNEIDRLRCWPKSKGITCITVFTILLLFGKCHSYMVIHIHPLLPVCTHRAFYI